MIEKLFIATGNENKKKEINAIFSQNEINLFIVTPKDFDDDSDPVEDGLSFKDNARIKARFFYEKYKLPCIGEDSGICIEYFNDFPGIHSKRFLENLDNYSKNEYILNLMKDVKNRNATFHCVICYIDENGQEHFFEGINKGEISLSQKGDEGFGYDPIFLIPSLNRTEAELGNDYKNKYGHRANAFNRFAEYLKDGKE